MKAKNISVLTIIVLFFSASIFMLHNFSSGLQKRANLYENIPVFQLPDLNGKTISDSTIDRNKTVLFYFFDTECNLCRSTFAAFKTNFDELSGYQILLITLVSEEKVKEFLNEIDFNPPGNMKILLDKNAKLFSLMDIKSPPTTLIYKKAILIKRFDGPVTVEALIKYLSE